MPIIWQSSLTQPSLSISGIDGAVSAERGDLPAQEPSNILLARKPLHDAGMLLWVKNLPPLDVSCTEGVAVYCGGELLSRRSLKGHAGLPVTPL